MQLESYRLPVAIALSLVSHVENAVLKFVSGILLLTL